MKYFLMILLLTSVNDIKSQYLWPVADKNLGEDLLFKPQDIIGTEKNYDNVFITGNDESIILAPEAGTIIDYAYVYYPKLNYSFSKSINYYKCIKDDNYDNQERAKFASQLKINTSNISVAILVETDSKISYMIAGLEPIHFLKSGSKIFKGDTLGKMGRSYFKIKENSIKYSMTQKGIPIDPMTVFNLKSTFVKVDKRNRIDYSYYKHSPKNLKEGYYIFKNALIEGHPGLLDYVDKIKLNEKFDEIETELNVPMTSEQFRKILNEIVFLLRDGHTAIYPVKYKLQRRKRFPILFGLNNDSVEVYATMGCCKSDLGKKIIKINNIEIDSIKEIVSKTKIRQDGYIESIKSRVLFLNFWAKYLDCFEIENSDSVLIEFSDNKKNKYALGNYADSLFEPKIIKPFRHEQNISVQSLKSKVGYIKISSFNLNFTERDELKTFIKKAIDSAYNAIIIDVRDNLGGNDQIVNELYSYFAQESWKQQLFNKINKVSNFNLFNNSTNYSPEIKYFNNYSKSKIGYINKGKSYSPNDSINFLGEVIVFINEYSLSASTTFSALVRKYNRGSLIGRETGNCYYGMNAMHFPKVQLENTGLELFMPLVKVVFDTIIDKKIPNGRGVLPDIHVPFTYAEFYGDDQIYINKALSIIHKSNQKSNRNFIYLLIIVAFVLLISILIFKRVNKYNK